jgi:putative ABC transport system permease protein
MIKNYLLITFRNLLKNKLFIFINVFGMGMAIACCVVAYLNWQYSNQWDSSQFPKADRVYRVQFVREFQGRTERNGIAPMPLGQIIRHNFRDVNAVVRYMSSYCDIRIGDDVFGTSMVFADSAFFDLFSYELKFGSSADFHNKKKVFISDEVARRYFDREDVVGRSITQIILGKDGIRRPNEFEVGGVFKQLPYNSSMRFDIITMFDNFWDINRDPDLTETSWKKWSHVLFLKIDDPTRVADITRRLQEYVEPQNKAREDYKVTSYFLENFNGMMKRNRAQPRVDSDYLRGGIPDEAVTVPAVMAAMLLLLACFNFTNTSIAISSQRLKEIGIRKVMGGLRKQLIAQFLGENLVLCLLGLIAGLLMAEFLVPAYDAMWPWLELNLSYSENAGFLLFLVGLLMATAIIAGSYPSFYVTSFEPVSILKGKAKFGGTNWFTRILLGGQFLISLLLIIMAIAFYQNGQYQKNYDLGFATRGVISVWVNDESGFNTFRDAIAPNNDIKVISGTKNHVANSVYNDPIKYESLEKEVDIIDVGDNYFEAMDITLVAGRQFRKDSETDRKESVIVSEALVNQFGWTDSPIGKRLVWMDTVQLFVVGVVKDIYVRALWQPVEPMMLRYAAPSQYQLCVVKMDPSKIASVNEFMEKKWKEVFPNTQYNGQMIDQELQETNDINKNVVTMFGFLGFFAALMTGIGLFTLVSLNIVKKMKEIGVRKVLGASIANIAGVINFEFAIILGVATILGGYLGYLAANWLMDSIWEYFLKLGLVSLSWSVLAMIVLAVLSVGYKTVTTASLNPTRTLRDE